MRFAYVGLASSGAPGGARKAPGAQTLRPTPKGKAKKKPRKQVSTVNSGDSTTVTRLYPSGGSFLKPERNLAKDHASRTGKGSVFLGLA